MNTIEATLYYTFRDACDVGSTVSVNTQTGEFDEKQAFNDMSLLTEDDTAMPEGQYLQVGTQRFEIEQNEGAGEAWTRRVADLKGLHRIAAVATAPDAAGSLFALRAPGSNLPNGFLILSIDDTNTAAFERQGRPYEIGRIIEGVADKVWQDRGQGLDLRKLDQVLFDVDSVAVGRWSYSEHEDGSALKYGAARLTVGLHDTDIAADEEAVRLNISSGLINTASHIRLDRQYPWKVTGDTLVIDVRDVDAALLGNIELRGVLDETNGIDMAEALRSTAVDMADGIEQGEFRYVVTTNSFPVGALDGPAQVDGWLVNAKGEKAPGFEQPKAILEEQIRNFTGYDMMDELNAVALGLTSFEDFERALPKDWAVEP